APAHGHPVDLDGDGDLDVVMAFGIAAAVGNDSPDSHQIAWYENLGQGLGAEWKKHPIAASFPQGFEAVAGDLDGAGDLDVAEPGAIADSAEALGLPQGVSRWLLRAGPREPPLRSVCSPPPAGGGEQTERGGFIFLKLCCVPAQQYYGRVTLSPPAMVSIA